MQADVLSAFLSNPQQKVKVFPTSRDIQPFQIDGRLVRRVFPFLLATAMVFTSCRDSEPSLMDASPAPQSELPAQNSDLMMQSKTASFVQSQSYWDDIYQKTVEKYNLTSLMDKEPLSFDEVQKLISERNNVTVNDHNFNHAPASVENFWEIVKGGVTIAQNMQSNPNLTAHEKQQYIDKSVEALSKISKIKGTTDVVDLTDYNNLHAFLFFEKVVKYQDDVDYVFHKSAGWIDENHECFGRYYQDHQDFEKAAQAYPGIEMFAKALYSNSDRFILSPEDSVYANALSHKMFVEWRLKQNIEEEHLCSFSSVEETDYSNAVMYGHSRGMQLGISLEIDPEGKTYIGAYNPVGLSEIHEEQHIMQLKSASCETPQDNLLQSEDDRPQDLKANENDFLLELGPTLYTIAQSDRIYKIMRKINRDQEVDYGKSIQIGDNSVPIGKIANWFGEMLDKYSSPSVDRVLMQKEVMQQLNQWGEQPSSQAKLLAINSINSSR